MGLLARRTCLRGAAAGLAGAGMTSIVPSTTRARPLGANDAIRVAVAGLGCRGPVLVRGFHRLPGVRIVALCDADRLHLDREAKAFADRNEPVEAHVDVRRVIENRDVDALVIATPDHWHALMSVWACQAGKDVYVEKPVSYCLREGRAMVAAARKHGRIVQAGTQNRSDKGLKAACDFLREGHLGKILLARGQDYPLEHWSIGRVEKPQPVPETVDYNLFQGPAPLLPVMRKQFHYDWHFFWPMGTGDCGNRGVHTFDHIRWLIGAAGLPERVVSVGGRFGFDDNGETPNTQIAWFDYKPVPILWEMKTLPARKGTKERESWKGIRASMVLECEGGRLQGGRGGATAFDREGKRIRHFKGDSGVTHMANFIAAVRSRDTRGLAAEILEGHHSSALCHLANISHRTGTPQPPDAIAKSFQDHSHLADAFERLHDHLKANEIDLVRTPLVAGPMLTLDTAAERFTGEGADGANAFLTRKYRAPFILPETA